MGFEPRTLDPKYIPTRLFQKLLMLSFQFSTPIRTENDTSRFPKEEVSRGVWKEWRSREEALGLSTAWHGSGHHNTKPS